MGEKKRSRSRVKKKKKQKKKKSSLELLEGAFPEAQGKRRETMHHGVAMLEGVVIQEFSKRHSSHEFQKIRGEKDKVEARRRRGRGRVKGREGAASLERATLKLLGRRRILLDIGNPHESMHTAQHCTCSRPAILVIGPVPARKLLLLRLGSEGPRHEGYTASEGEVPLPTKNTHVRVVEPAGALELGALDLDAIAVQQAAQNADRANVQPRIQQGAPRKDLRVRLHEIHNLHTLVRARRSRMSANIAKNMTEKQGQPFATLPLRTATVVPF